MCPILKTKIVVFGVYRSSPACPNNNGSIKIKMSMNHWWNEVKEMTKYSEKGLSQCHLVHQKSHMDYTEIKPIPKQ